MWYYLAIGLTIIANVFYHLAQKSISGNVNPFVSLIATYLTAILISLAILPFYRQGPGIGESIKSLNWASIVLGVAIIGLELGYLLAYRMGWQISLAGVFSNVAVALLLIPIGVLLFREHLSGLNVLGLAFCVLGLILTNIK